MRPPTAAVGARLVARPPTAAVGTRLVAPPRPAGARSQPRLVIAPIDIGRDPASTAPSAKVVASRAKAHRLAAQCGLLGALGAALDDDEWLDGTPPVGATDLVASLRAGVRRRAAGTIDADRAATALEWFVDFVTATSRVPFVALAHAGDIAASVYNAQTLELFAEYIRRRGSRQRGQVGKTLASDTIDGYVSTIKTLRSFEAHYAVVLDSTDVVRPRASKATRRTQGPPGERQLKRGIRASHLRRLIAMGYDRSSARGVAEWAAALVAWNVLLRGGELGVVPGAAFDPRRDATFGAIEWRLPCSYHAATARGSLG